jgi:hypothetical protein
MLVPSGSTVRRPLGFNPNDSCFPDIRAVLLDGAIVAGEYWVSSLNPGLEARRIFEYNSWIGLEKAVLQFQTLPFGRFSQLGTFRRS